MRERLERIIKNPKRYRTLARLIFSKKPYPGQCPVCGSRSLFLHVSDVPREDLKCIRCFSIARNRHVALVLARITQVAPPYSLTKFAHAARHLSIYETQAGGTLHSYLHTLPGYTCSEFFPDIPRGNLSPQSIRCEDLQQLTFPNDSFDIVISQDVFEHIREPERAWREVYRVLKPGGTHVFTIPYYRDKPTQRRIELVGEREIDVLPRDYHSDSVRDGLVYTEFGRDLISNLTTYGFVTTEYAINERDIERNGIFWSWVFASRKIV